MITKQNSVIYRESRLLATIFLLVTLLFTPKLGNDIFAQSKSRQTQTVRKRVTTTPKRRSVAPTRKKASTRSQQAQVSAKEDTPLPPPKPEPHVYEGSLLYRNYEYHSAVIRKFSYGQAYNGERTMIVTVKGNSIHIENQDIHIHTILRLNENKVYQYSDITKTGVEGDDDFIKTYLSSYDPSINIGKITKTFTIKSNKESIKYKDQDCNIFHGELNAGGNNSTDVETWNSKLLLASPSYKYFFYGLPTGDGIVIKGIYCQTGMIPILGKMKSTVATELIGIKERHVDDSEMQPPSDIRIERMTSPSQLTRFYKANRKELKKRGITPESTSKKEAQYNIKAQWDFADEWIKKKANTDYLTTTWDVVGEVVNNIINIFEPTSEPAIVSNDNLDISNIEDTDTGTSSRDKKKDAEDRREKEKKRKQQEAEARMFRSSEHQYSEYANRITAMSNDSYPYSGWSKDKKRQEARSLQSKMRKIRTEYKEKTGKDLPAAVALQKWENWSP